MKLVFKSLFVSALAIMGGFSNAKAQANDVLLAGAESQQNQETCIDLTLSKAIEIALAENPTIRVADQDIELKKIADKEAWQNLLPNLSANLALQHSIKVAEIRTSMGTFKMGMDGTTTAQGGLTLNLPVFAPTVYQTMKLSKEDILLAQEKANASRQDLVNQVTKAYYSSLLAKDSYEVMQKSFKVAKDNYELVEKKFNVGKVSEYDKISAEVQMRTMSSTVVSAESGLKLALLRLKVLMGVTADVNINIMDSLKAYENAIILPAEIGADEVENNTDLKQIDFRAGLLQRTRKVLFTNFMPTVGAQLTGQYQSMSNDNWNLFKYTYSPSVTFGLNINIPVFTASNWTKLKSNRVQISQLQDTRENTRRQISMAAKSHRENMISSVVKLESDRTAVSQADKAVSISAKRYEVGRGTILELNQSEIAYTQAELTYCQTIYDYLSNKADLDYKLGRNY